MNNVYGDEEREPLEQEEFAQDADTEGVDDAEETEGKESDSSNQIDIESIWKQLQPRITPLLEEEARRRKQSVRDAGDSILERVNARLAQSKIGLDAAVTGGQIDAATAKQLQRDLRDQFEQEEYAQVQRQRAQEQAYQQIEQANPSQAADPAVKQNVEAWFNHIFTQSGLEANDPELALLPAQLSGDPTQAIEQYRSAVNNAIAQKQVRLRTRKQAPNVDMGSGNQAARPNPLAGITDPDELWKLAKKSGRIG